MPLRCFSRGWRGYAPRPGCSALGEPPTTSISFYSPTPSPRSSGVAAGSPRYARSPILTPFARLLLFASHSCRQSLRRYASGAALPSTARLPMGSQSMTSKVAIGPYILSKYAGVCRYSRPFRRGAGDTCRSGCRFAREEADARRAAQHLIYRPPIVPCHAARGARDLISPDDLHHFILKYGAMRLITRRRVVYCQSAPRRLMSPRAPGLAESMTAAHISRQALRRGSGQFSLDVCVSDSSPKRLRKI